MQDGGVALPCLRAEKGLSAVGVGCVDVCCVSGAVQKMAWEGQGFGGGAGGLAAKMTAAREGAERAQ